MQDAYQLDWQPIWSHPEEIPSTKLYSLGCGAPYVPCSPPAACACPKATDTDPPLYLSFVVVYLGATN
jgi:hypothetical protein